MKYNNNLKLGIFLISTGSFLYITFLILNLLRLDFPDSLSFTNWTFQSLLVTVLWYAMTIMIYKGDKKGRKWYIVFVMFIAGNAVLLRCSGLETITVSSFVVLYIAAVLNIVLVSQSIVSMIIYSAMTFFINIPLTINNYGAVAIPLFLMISLTISSIAIMVKRELTQLYSHMEIFDQARWAASEFVRVNMRMQDNVDRSEHIGRRGERLRIAREIHDSVGYTLTAVLFQIQAVQEVLKVDAGLAMERLKAQEEALRAAMQEVRREVTNLRSLSDIENTGKHRWERLCTVFGDSTGIRIYTNISENLEQVNKEISNTVYRIIQEAVTNAYRHGAADFIDVSMEWEEYNQRILLRISDNGKGDEEVTLGNGLRGMKERVSELGGDVVLQTQLGRGFDIGIEIPWDGEKKWTRLRFLL